ncbi:phage tail protein, partial [Xenorhabdus sp. XENO-7]|nr:phage tail protein [Xenorhabdus aichiensis]
MSNIQSQLNKVLSTVGKLTGSFKSFQRHHKKLENSVDKIHNQFKKLNKTVESLKPIVGYAQETARIRTDLKAYNQTIKQSLSVRQNSTRTMQVSAASQSANIIQTTQIIKQENSSSKKSEFNLGVTGNMTNNFTLLDKLVININPKITILFSILNKINAVLNVTTGAVKVVFQTLVGYIQLFGNVGIKTFDSLRVSLNIFTQLGIQAFVSLKVSLNIFAQLGIQALDKLKSSLDAFAQLGLKAFEELKASLNFFAQLGVQALDKLKSTLDAFVQLGIQALNKLTAPLDVFA